MRRRRQEQPSRRDGENLESPRESGIESDVEIRDSARIRDEELGRLFGRTRKPKEGDETFGDPYAAIFGPLRLPTSESELFGPIPTRAKLDGIFGKLRREEIPGLPEGVNLEQIFGPLEADDNDEVKLREIIALIKKYGNEQLIGALNQLLKGERD